MGLQAGHIGLQDECLRLQVERLRVAGQGVRHLSAHDVEAHLEVVRHKVLPRAHSGMVMPARGRAAPRSRAAHTTP
eukprot:scaffold20078_cov36-Phaeocystis_antarctica.AAC.2